MRATSFGTSTPAEEWPRISFELDGTEVSVARIESTSYRFICAGGLDLTPGSRVSARFLNDASGGGGDRNAWLDEFVFERDPGLSITGIAAGDIVASVTGPTIQVTTLPGITPAEIVMELTAADNSVAMRRSLFLPPFCFTGRAAGGCAAFDSTAVADGPYRLRVTGRFANGITRIESVGVRVANRASIAYGPPLVILTGGVYSGAYQSTDSKIAAITVRTSDPVVIENATVRGPGALISNGFYDANGVCNYQVRTQLTVRNVVGFGTTPTVALTQKGAFVTIEEGDDLRLENNYVDGASQTVYARQFRTGIRPGDGIRIMRNIVRNIDGRVANGRGGYIDRDASWPNYPTNNYPRGVSFMQFVQFNTVYNQPNAEIGWNEIINEPGISRAEDVISFFETGGTAASPLRIHDNYIQGAYPHHVQYDGYSGGGIMTGDGGRTTLRGYIYTYSNQVIETVNYGLGVLGGHDNQVYENRTLASGILADGRIIRSQNVGVQFWDYTGGAALVPPTFYGNIVRDNVVGWAQWNGSAWSRNDTFVPACSTGGSMCFNNTSFGGVGSRIPANIAATEYLSWRAKVGAQSITLGPR